MTRIANAIAIAVATMKNTTILRLLRRIRYAYGPSVFGHRKNDPDARLEELERWSAQATLWILAGILIEIAFIWLPIPEFWRKIGDTCANALIGVGLCVEYVVILRTVVAAGESKRLSDKKVAEANERAAEANLETEKLKAQFAWRRLPSDKIAQIAAKLRPTPAAIQISYLSSDPECHYFVRQWWAAFRLAKWPVEVCGGSYADLWFGIILPGERWAAEEPASREATALVVDALTEAGIGFNIAPIPRWSRASVSSPEEPMGERIARMFIGPRQPTVG